jgi:hypothetical protein
VSYSIDGVGGLRTCEDFGIAMAITAKNGLADARSDGGNAVESSFADATRSLHGDARYLSGGA